MPFRPQLRAAPLKPFPVSILVLSYFLHSALN